LATPSVTFFKHDNVDDDGDNDNNNAAVTGFMDHPKLQLD